MSSSTVPKRDHRQEVTDSIIKMLEKGTAPWQKPWTAGALELPLNPTTGKPYRGGNAVHLMAVGLASAYDDPRWMTYRQADENGWQVRKGEKGTQIEFWDFSPARQAKDDTQRDSRPVSDDGPESEPRESQRIVHRIYTVFNARQIDGIPEHQRKSFQEFEVVQAAENILTNSGARISHDQMDRAFYNRNTDSIHLPTRTAFNSASDYYGTALHELAHWSGHPARLNRATLNDSKGFGDESYAREELRAELASVFLAAERGIPHDPANHAAYVGSWIKALRDDRNEIFRAAKDAHRAADFISALERQQSVEQALKSLDEAPVRRETTEYVAQFDSGSKAVEITNKADAQQQRSPAQASTTGADKLAGPKQLTEEILDNQVRPSRLAAEDLKRSFSAAQDLSKSSLGTGAKTYVAQTNSGVYLGEIIGQTDLHVVQRLNGKSAVAHMKHLVGTAPELGSHVLITYSHGNALLQKVPARERDRDLAR